MASPSTRRAAGPSARPPERASAPERASDARRHVTEPHRTRRPAADRIDEILNVATHLFAEHGYDGVGTREIATAAGLNISTVHHHVGSKADLYERVLAVAHEREAAALAPLAARLDAGPLRDRDELQSLLHETIDHHVDLLDDHPEIAFLWTRRWLDARGADDPYVRRFSVPLYETTLRCLSRARRAGLIGGSAQEDRLAVRGFTWLLYGWFTSGPLDAPRSRRRALGQLRALLYGYADQAIGL